MSGTSGLTQPESQTTHDRREATMTIRDNVHQLVDTLPEERLADVLDYMAELQDGEEPLSSETEAAIEEGLDDLRQGRLITLQEYRRMRRA